MQRVKNRREQIWVHRRKITAREQSKIRREQIWVHRREQHSKGKLQRASRYGCTAEEITAQ